MDVVVRPLGPDEVDAFTRSVAVPFLENGKPDLDIHWRRHLELERAWVAVDGDRVVGNACIFSRDLTLPSAPAKERPVVPFAAVSGVGVHPTHRRRGLLRQMMGHMLDDARHHGEMLAGLLASESSIYGRFGFGQATTVAEVVIDSRRSAFVAPVPEIDIRLVDTDEATGVIPDLFDRFRRNRAGEPDRNAARWQDTFDDPASQREGASSLFYAVCPEGYAAYRARLHEVAGIEQHQIEVLDLRGSTPEVEAALWRFVLDLDLIGEVTARGRPVDDPLRWRLVDPRQLRVAGLTDVLYVRLLDIAAALEARGYRRSGRLVLEVYPAQTELAEGTAGRYVLDAGPDGASCRAARTGEEPDLRLGMTELGSLYLGGVTASVLAAAGRVQEDTPGALDVAGALFADRLAPVTTTGF
jgi:predicted acetyltransferase